MDCDHLLLQASEENALNSSQPGWDHPAEGIAAVERLLDRPFAPCR